MYQPQGNDYMNQPHAVAPAHVIGARRQPVNWAVAGAYFVAVLGLGIAVAVTALFISYRGTVSDQMTQMRNALSAAQSTQSKDANAVSNLSGQVSRATAELLLLTPYNMTCSQYLTGPNGGPSTFYFPCRLKPGS